jgi:hypothetical protein
MKSDIVIRRTRASCRTIAKRDALPRNESIFFGSHLVSFSIYFLLLKNQRIFLPLFMVWYDATNVCSEYYPSKRNFRRIVTLENIKPSIYNNSVHNSRSNWSHPTNTISPFFCSPSIRISSSSFNASLKLFPLPTIFLKCSWFRCVCCVHPYDRPVCMGLLRRSMGNSRRFHIFI